MKRTVAAMCAFLATTSVLLGSLASGQPRPDFASHAKAFQPKSRRRSAELPPWQWPSTAQFQGRFDRYDADARPWGVCRGKFRLHAPGFGPEKTGIAHVAFGASQGVWRFGVIAEEADDAGSTGVRGISWRTWRLERGDWGEEQLDFQGEEGATLRVTGAAPVPRRTLRPDLWTAWVYATTLLEAGDPEADPPVSMGGCSMDTRPMKEAISHAKAAQKQGLLGRFLRFRVRVLGDRFERVAWSSGGQALMRTDADALAQAPIDTDRFLVGLVVTLNAEHPSPIGLNAFRLGRGIAEAGRAPSLVPVLKAIAVDDRVDVMNRVRATQVLTYVLAHDQSLPALGRATSQSRSVESVAADLAALGIPEAARRWLMNP
jgi:hypothetical protein